MPGSRGGSWLRGRRLVPNRQDEQGTVDQLKLAPRGSRPLRFAMDVWGAADW